MPAGLANSAVQQEQKSSSTGTLPDVWSVRGGTKTMCKMNEVFINPNGKVVIDWQRCVEPSELEERCSNWWCDHRVVGRNIECRCCRKGLTQSYENCTHDIIYKLKYHPEEGIFSIRIWSRYGWQHNKLQQMWEHLVPYTVVWMNRDYNKPLPEFDYSVYDTSKSLFHP